MSEPGTRVEIEDVLASIRRLVSQDASLPRPSGLPHRVPEVVAVDADCLVLTPAQRIDEGVEDDPAEATPVSDAETAMPPTSEVAAGLAENAGTVVETPQADSAEMPQAAPVSAEEGPAEEVNAPAAEVEAAEAEDFSAPPPDADLPPSAASATPAPLSEAEKLLSEAEAVLAETSVTLEDAETALDAAWQDAAPSAQEGNTQPETASLGEELARLESTIAELEAAVAESGAEFEPEEGHPFQASGVAPLRELPESFEDVALAEAVDAPDILDETAVLGAADEVEDAEMILSATDSEMATPSWDESEEGGMGWAEATLSLARSSAPRRLHLSDAEEQLQQADLPRSSYEDMRDELEDDIQRFDTSAATSPLFEEGLIDEETLREMVAQMIREELRGTLGERITQNVRKLVRREIQRAIMGQDFE